MFSVQGCLQGRLQRRLQRRLRTPLFWFAFSLLTLLAALVAFVLSTLWAYGISGRVVPDARLAAVTAITACPLLAYATLLWLRIRPPVSATARNFLALPALLLSSTFTLFFGYTALADPGDLILWLPLTVYGLFLLLTAFAVTRY